jgi:rubrerythrin
MISDVSDLNFDSGRKNLMATQENLQAAFAGESQANRKYTAFAKKAEADGYPMIAKLFRAAAAAETVHALSHLRTMGGIKTTAENLQEAIAGEAYEFQKMYPEFLAEAEQAGEKAAIRTFSHANEVEKVHHKLYSEALATLQQGKDLAQSSIWVCAVCGHTHIGEGAPERCPVCNAMQGQFNEVA